MYGMREVLGCEGCGLWTCGEVWGGVGYDSGGLNVVAGTCSANKILGYSGCILYFKASQMN